MHLVRPNTTFSTSSSSDLAKYDCGTSERRPSFLEVEKITISRFRWILLPIFIAAFIAAFVSHSAELAAETTSTVRNHSTTHLPGAEWDGVSENRIVSRDLDGPALSTFVLPPRDVVDLARRFRPVQLTPQLPATTEAMSIGESRRFWISDAGASSSRVITARLVERSSHIDAFVQEGESVNLEKLRISLATIENHLLPTLLREFAASTIPLDELRLAVLNVRLSGVAGYYSSVNGHPAWVFPSSNELPLIGMNVWAVSPGTVAYASTLSHELAHFLQWRLDPAEDTWVNEGTAELAIRAVGYEPSRNVQAFAIRPNTSLTLWTSDISQTPAHYGAADLFFSYIANRLGGFSAVGEILARPERGIAGIEHVLRARGIDARPTAFDSFFLDWVVANWANISGDARFSYPERTDFRVTDQSLSTMSLPAIVDIAPYAARYVELRSSDAGRQLEIAMQPTVPVIGAPPRPATIWWSGRGDNADSRLTRELDLSNVPNATLRFWTWFDLESDFDYAYVSASVDEGVTWTSLPGRQSTSNDPNDVNLGNGFTGKTVEESQWTHETIDLSAFVGRKIQLRFEVVNDDAYVGDGFAIDETAVPEIGWLDQPGDSGWKAEGFIRIGNRLASKLNVRIAYVRGSHVSIIPFVQDSLGYALFTIPAEVASADRATVIIANHTAWTSRPSTVQIREPSR